MKLGVPGHLDVSLEDVRLFLVIRRPKPVAGLRKPPDHGFDRVTELLQLRLDRVLGYPLAFWFESFKDVNENRT